MARKAAEFCLLNRLIHPKQTIVYPNRLPYVGIANCQLAAVVDIWVTGRGAGSGGWDAVLSPHTNL